MAQELITVGIEVSCSQTGSNGKAYIAQCGALSGGRNIFTINTFDVTNAASQGFTPVSKLTNYTDVACKSTLP